MGQWIGRNGSIDAPLSHSLSFVIISCCRLPLFSPNGTIATRGKNKRRRRGRKREERVERMERMEEGDG
jgi:hypothetical protein